MKPRAFLFLLWLLPVAGGLRAAEAAVPAVPAESPESAAGSAGAKLPPVPVVSPRFKQVRERIDALFSNRNETPAPPDPRHNPFRSPGTVIEARPVAAPEPASSTPSEPLPVASATDLARLQAAVATLKVSGTFEKDGRLFLVINAKPYKDNDVLQTQIQGEPVYMRVRQVSRHSVTVVLNEAEMTLKF
jgi:hypothetical protein